MICSGFFPLKKKKRFTSIGWFYFFLTLFHNEIAVDFLE